MQAFAPVSKSAPRRRAEKWRTTTILLCACCRWTRPPVEIFDIETGAELGMVVGGGNTVTGVAISPDEETGYFTSSYLPSCVAC